MLKVGVKKKEKSFYFIQTVSPNAVVCQSGSHLSVKVKGYFVGKDNVIFLREKVPNPLKERGE